MPDYGGVAASLVHVPAPPAGPELIRYAGGKRALTEQLSGLSGPPSTLLRASDSERYAEELRRWRSAQRRVQRYDAGEGKQHRAARLAPVERDRLVAVAEDRKLADLYRSGARARAVVTLRAASPVGRRRGNVDEREREIPARGSPGVWIAPDLIDDVMRLEEGGESAEVEFWSDLLAAYGLTPDMFEITGVQSLQIWPADEDEPT